MEARINYHIRGIFMLREKPIPLTLNKHLTDKIFNKQNKEAMEQVLYYLLPLTNHDCLKTLPWPITNFKEAAMFRNAATLIINNLNGFVYEKSSNVGKVTTSLLANPGGPIFIYFMYQLCVYIKCCELKKKGINILNAPLYIDNEYIDKKIAMFAGVSKSNFNEVNEIITRIEYALKNTIELAVKWKELIQDSKQRIKDLKSELLNIEHCEATESEVTELKQKYIDLYNNFEQNKLIAMNCQHLADLILKTPEFLDANLVNVIYNVNKEELAGSDGKVDFVKLLYIIKNTLNNYILWCNNLNDEDKVMDKISETQYSVDKMTKQMQCYKKCIQFQNNIIDSLDIENCELEKEIFTSRSLENMNPKLQSVYKQIPLITLNTEIIDKPKLMTSEYNKKSRRSISLPCSNKPYNYQTISFDKIKDVYKATLLNQNQVDVQNDSKSVSYSLQPTETSNSTEIDEPNYLNINNTIQIKENEMQNVSISRKSIENIKQKLIRIKTQAQAMSTIPHSPRSPI